MIRKLLSYTITIVFLFYWFITFAFVSPKNYINISLMEYSTLFDSFFYQKWGFFAPPPKTNDRLFYVFENKANEKDIKIFEVIEPILIAKTEKNPFNSEEDLLDYVLSNSINSIRESIVRTNKFIKFQEQKKEKTLSKKEKESLFDAEINNTTGIKTLKNYALFVANKNNIDTEKYIVKFIISTIEIPPFSERNNKSYKCKTSDMYVSENFNINNTKKNKINEIIN